MNIRFVFSVQAPAEASNFPLTQHVFTAHYVVNLGWVNLSCIDAYAAY